MLVSLIITTFNWPEALKLSIQGALSQTYPPDEIIIADDGSSDGTADLIALMASTTDINIIHSWQRNKGFRAAKSRNRAIALARGDYIILIDGDIVVEKHFIEDHLFVARHGRFVQGTRVLLDKRKTQKVLRLKRLKLAITDSGLKNRKNYIRSRLLSSIFSHNKSSLSGLKTCNFAFWRQDAIEVNGFNEDFEGWGREDSEFAVRLMNKGSKRYNLRFMAVAFHMYHNDCTRNQLFENENLLREAVEKKLTRCVNGISTYLP